MFKTHHIIYIIWITIGLLAISCPARSGPVDDNEIKKGRDCKTFCGSCGCIGFYCGEECICECNEEKNSDTECIASIQENAVKRKIPFEILIQGPSSNRFLRNALKFDQNQQQCSKGDSGRSKRSTVVIYKPAVENTVDINGFCEKPLEKQVDLSKRELFRGKRALDVDWFTDFANTLTKPAPMQGASEDEEDQEDQEEEPEDVSDTDGESNFIPKIRGKVRHALHLGENESLVAGIRKTVRKIEDKALKAVELDEAAKKIRGAISTIRNKAEEILLPTSEDAGNVKVKRAARRQILRKILDFFAEAPVEEESSL